MSLLIKQICLNPRIQFVYTIDRLELGKFKVQLQGEHDLEHLDSLSAS